MASITKTINGIVCTLNPAVLVPFGPSGQPAEFQSQQGTGLSTPITVTFDKPILQFSVTVVGLSYSGHTALGFDASGKIVAQVITNTSNPDLGAGGGIEQITVSTTTTPIVRVQLNPPGSDYVAYRNINVTQAPDAVVAVTAPPPQPTISAPVVPTPTPLPPAARTILLSNVITIDATTIDRQYVKGSLRSITPATINISNISDEVEVQVSLSGLAGVSFDPTSFTLAKKSTQQVTINFDPNQIDGLPEGINTVNAAINLTSNTAVIDPLPPPPPPPPPPAVVAAPTPPLPEPVEAPPPIIPEPQPVIRSLAPQPPTPVATAPVTFTPVPPPPSTPWVDGTTNDLHFGSPPAGWVQDPFGGEWYPPTDPFVLRNFDAASRNPSDPRVQQVLNSSAITTTTPPPPPPAPTPPPPLPESDVGGGGSFFDTTDVSITRIFEE